MFFSASYLVRACDLKGFLAEDFPPRKMDHANTLPFKGGDPAYGFNFFDLNKVLGLKVVDFACEYQVKHHAYLIKITFSDSESVADSVPGFEKYLEFMNRVAAPEYLWEMATFTHANGVSICGRQRMNRKKKDGTVRPEIPVIL